MRVAGPDEAELVGIGHAPVLDGQAAAQGVAHVVAGRLAQNLSRHPVGHDLEVGPLVVRRQCGVCLGRAFRLGDLGNRLVAGATRRVGVIDRAALERLAFEHATARTVHIVRNRQGVHARLAPLVHRCPQVFRVEGIESRERRVRTAVTAEHDVPV